MSVNPSQSWITPTTSLFGSGGSGDSNFPSGINIGTGVNLYQIAPATNVAWGSNTLTVQDLSGNNEKDFACRNLWASGGTNPNLAQTGEYSADGIFYQGYQSQGQGARFLAVEDIALNNTNTTSAFTLTNISSISGTYFTTQNNPSYYPINFTLNTQNTSQNGLIALQLTYNANDTGANPTLVAGADPSGSFVYSFWPGYVTLPLNLGGQDVNIISDNETFLRCKGDDANIGTISTGVHFLSGMNTLSSIADPSGASIADMTALLSTLKGLYPNCFA
jgi:hypothetical protein